MEANPEEIMPVSEQQEEAAMETITELENWFGGRHLAVGRRQQPK
jgi:hypothetical protein